MLKCNFISNGTQDSLDELKIAALYYDKIELLNNIVYTLESANQDDKSIHIIRGIHQCLEQKLLADISLLTDENIVAIENSTEVTIRPADPKELESFVSPTELEIKLFERSQEIMNKTGNKLWQTENQDGKLLFLFNDEVKKVHSAFVDDFRIGSKVDFGFIHNYYSNLLFHILKYVNEGKNVINTSAIIDTYFNNYYSETLKTNLSEFNKLGKPNIGTEAIKYFVPNVTSLSIEDILELRLKLKDELENYRYFTSELNNSIVNSTEVVLPKDKINYYLENKINPALKELKSKVLKSKLSVADRFLTEIKDPKSYTPVIGSIFLNLSAHISLLLSVGLIGTNTFVKWKQETLDFKNNGLYYLLKLKNKANK